MENMEKSSCNLTLYYIYIEYGEIKLAPNWKLIPTG